MATNPNLSVREFVMSAGLPVGLLELESVGMASSSRAQKEHSSHTFSPLPDPFSSTRHNSNGPLHLVINELQAGLDRGSSDGRLLEMLFSLVINRDESKLLSDELIVRFGTLGDVVAAPLTSLCSVVGMSSPIVRLLKLVQTAMFSVAHAEVKHRSVINNWNKLMEYLKLTLSYEPVEHLRVLFLDTRNHLIADEMIARGTVNNVGVHPREVVKRGLALEATALILVHNHPSGCCDPSEQDIVMTTDIQAALSPLEIVLHDHVIIGKGNWFSFRQQRLLTACR